MADPAPLWSPSPEWCERTALARFTHWLEAERGVSADGYHALWRWSVEDLDGFWAAIWDFFAVEADPPRGAVLADRAMPGAKWFPGTRLNYAEHVFRGKPDDRVAILHAGEARELAEMTWGELRALTARVRSGLEAAGVGQGDRVVAYLPNIAETVAAFLATASLGAVWSSASPDFGVRSLVDRFAQIEPTVLLAVDGYSYNGRVFDRREVVERLRAEMPSLAATVVLPYAGTGEVPGASAWEDFLGPEGAELSFARVPFDHPLWVLYSSGTTGLPKAIVQGQGGILLEHLKKLHLHVDAQTGDRIFWFTTTGWMMWNFLVSGLLTDAAIVLYDGSPAHPDLGALWDLAEATRMTCFGTSAGFVDTCRKEGVEPRAGRDLSALRALGSTGSPLSSEGFDWVYEQLGGDLWLFSTSGGTDVCTAFVGGVPTLPVYRGELQARALGAKVEAWDEEGRPLEDEVGELVITEPMPSMPLFLWNDPDGSRLRESYFDVFPGTWRHGDWIRITPRGTAVITGRSDATINRGGIRMGTAEIYAAVLAEEDVLDALVVDVDGWMPLFVVLRGGGEVDEELRRRIARRVREDCSPRHVPDEVYAVAAIPRTLSNKVLEVPVKKILQGAKPEEAAARESLQDPEALDVFVALARERAAN